MNSITPILVSHESIKAPWGVRFLVLAVFQFALLNVGNIVSSQSIPPFDPSRIPKRELRVPMEAMPILLESPNKRLIISREEYESLLRDANIRPDSIAAAVREIEKENAIPTGFIVQDAIHQIRMEAGRATVESTYRVELLKKGWHVVPLDFQRVQLLEIRWDNKEPMLIESSPDRPGVLLLATGVGVHELKIKLTAAAADSSAQQNMSFVVPKSVTARWTMEAPGNVEVLAGAMVNERRVDEEAGKTLFQLLPDSQGDTPHGTHVRMVMTLNNKSVKDKNLVDVRSQQLSQITLNDELAFAKFHLHVLQGTLSKLAVEIPAGFDIQAVQSPALAKWGIGSPEENDLGSEKILNVDFREPLTGETDIYVLATRTAEKDAWKKGPWKSPRWIVRDVAKHDSSIGVQLSKPLRWKNLDIGKSLPLSTSVFDGFFDPFLNAIASKGAPTATEAMRFATCVYDPIASERLVATIEPVTLETSILENWSMSIKERELELQGSIQLVAGLENIESVEFSIPTTWRLSRVFNEQNQELAWFKSTGTAADDPGYQQYRVKLSALLRSMASARIRVELASIPEGWLTEWEERDARFPRVRWKNATIARTVLSVATTEDYSIEEKQRSGLEPLFLSERGLFQLSMDSKGDNTNSLAYIGSASDPWDLTIQLRKKKALRSAEVFAFVDVAPSGWKIRYELNVAPEQASISEVAFSLPESTPAELAISSLEGVGVRSYSQATNDGRRLWKVKLAEKTIAPLRLLIEYRLPLQAEGRKVPVPKIEEAQYQSGIIAIDRDDTMDVEIESSLRRADVGELIDAKTNVGSNFLGAYGYSFYEIEEPVVSLIAVEREIGRLPATIATQLNIQSWISRQSWSYHQATFQLLTAKSLIQLELPEDSELWSIVIDGLPSLPQRNGKSVLIEVPQSPMLVPSPFGQNTNAGVVNATTNGSSVANWRSLTVTYGQPIAKLGLSSRVRVSHPVLIDYEGQERIELPIADVQWSVHYPASVQVSTSEEANRVDNIDSFPFNALQRLTSWLPASKSVMLSAERVAGRGDLAQLTSEDFRARGATSSDREQWMEPSSGAKSELSDAKKDAAPAPQFDAPDVTGSPSTPLEIDKALGINQMRKSTDATRSLALDSQQETQWKQLTVDRFATDNVLELNAYVQSPWNRLGWASVFWVIVLSLVTWNWSWGHVWKWSVCLMGGAILLPLLLPDLEMLPIVCEPLFWACFLSLLFKGVWQIARACIHSARQFFSQNQSIAVSAVVVLCFSILGPQGSLLCAQEPVQKSWSELFEAIRAKAGEENRPVEIPADAIVVPYSPGAIVSDAKQERLYIPLDTFDYLKGLARKDDAQRVPSPRDFSLGNMTYRATLGDGNSLEWIGSTTIVNHTDRVIQVPFALSGCVLTEAKLGGRVASLHANGEMIFLNVPSSSEEQTFEVVLKATTMSQSGWRSVNVRVPSSPSTTLLVTVPKSETEVKIAGVADRQVVATSQENQTLVWGLPSNGLNLQWRPKVSIAEADQGLEANIQSQLIVLESGLTWISDVEFRFRRGRREEFSVRVPDWIRIDKVIGENVKAWKIDSTGTLLRVEVLKTAVESERFQVVCSMPDRIGIDPSKSIALPQLAVPESINTRGKLTLYASSALSVQWSNLAGLVREDLVEAPVSVSHPFPMVPLAAFRFSKENYSGTLTASAIVADFAANTRTQWILNRSEELLKSTIRVAPSAASSGVTVVEVEVPAGWKWNPPTSSSPLEYEVVEPTDSIANAPAKLRIQFASPLTQAIAIELEAKKPRTAGSLANAVLDVPQVIVPGARQNGGKIDIVTDTGFNVQLQKSELCKRVPVATNAPQSPLASNNSTAARLSLEYTLRNTGSPQRYSATVQLVPIRPVIDSISVSNVKVTKHSVEETLFLEWNIREAGVDRLQWVLPARLKDAIVSAPLVRRITRTPIDATEGSPIRFEIELQDQVLGEYRVLVQRDFPLGTGATNVSIPRDLTGETRHRFITVENAGFDELVPELMNRVTPLVRGDSYWNEFAKIFGSAAVKAYRVQESATATDTQEATALPAFSFALKSREMVNTVKARIGLAKTELSLDASGSYRGQVEYRMENFSEPFLEIELPAGSTLWTATVADQPIKPGKSPNKPTASGATRMRIPLVRTQTGDLDYGIRLLYAGSIQKTAFYSALEFPFIQSVNVQVELSQLKLKLPKSHWWYRFDGTLGRVSEEADLAAGWLSFKNKQIKGLSQILAQSNDEFTQLRAVENLKRLESNVRNEILSQQSVSNSNWSMQITENDTYFSEAKKKQESLQEANQLDQVDNRDRLASRFSSQTNSRAGGNSIIYDAQALETSKSVGRQSQIPMAGGMGGMMGGPGAEAPMQQQAYQGNVARKNADTKQMAQKYRSKIQSETEQQLSANLNDSGRTQNRLDGSQNFDYAMNGLGGPIDGRAAAGEMSVGNAAPQSYGMPPGGYSGGMGGGGMGGRGGNSQRGRQNLPTPPGTTGMPNEPLSEAKPSSGPLGGNNDIFSESTASPVIGLAAPVVEGRGTDAGLRSLDFEMPSRGEEFLFSTPKGDLRLVAYGVSQPSMIRWVMGLVVLATTILLTRVRFRTVRN